MTPEQSDGKCDKELALYSQWQTSVCVETSGEMTELSFEPDVRHCIDVASTTILRFRIRWFT